MPLNVRPATLPDTAGLSDLAARTFPLACPPDLPRQAIESFIAENLSRTAFRTYLTATGHSVLAGLDATGAIRAYALLVDGTSMDETCAGMIEGDPPVGISKFYVDPGLHGAGAARQLLDAVVEHARADGAASLWLATNVANARARAFYVKSGFLERGHRVFTVGGKDNSDVVLELPLRGGA